MGEIWATYTCPHCGEPNEIPVDSGGAEDQTYVEDCQVCCKPNVLHIKVDLEAGVATAWAAADG